MKRELKPGDECGCGNPATKVKGGEFVCDRCDEIERRMYGQKGGSYSQLERVAKRKRDLFAQVMEPYRVAMTGV